MAYVSYRSKLRTKPTSVSADDRRIAREVLSEYGKGAYNSPAYSYHLKGGTSGASGVRRGASGSGGSGSSGGSSRTRKPLDLKVYKAGKYKGKKTATREANVLADAQLNESLSASRNSRDEAGTRYAQRMRELDLSRNRDTAENERARVSAQAQLDNTALGRGMGYGQGFTNTQASTNLGYARNLADLMDNYLMQSQNAVSDRDLILRNMDEADRLARSNRAASFIQFLTDLNNNYFNQYLGVEGLRGKEIDSANAARTARYNTSR